jgi:hypothetical protein
VIDCIIVTPAILCIEVIISRYFLDKSSTAATVSGSGSGGTGQHRGKAGGEIYQNAHIYLYITNCPAEEMKTYIEDRIFFSEIRNQLNYLMQSTSSIPSNSNDSNTKDGEGGGDSYEASRAILSNAVGIYNEMNYVSITLEEQCCAIYQQYLKALSQYSKQEFPSLTLLICLENQEKIISQLSGRICRMKLYIATLFGIKLSIPHQFEVKLVTKEIEQEIAKNRHRYVLSSAATSEADSSGSTALTSTKATSFLKQINTTKQQIESLFELAEKKIVESTICGWNYSYETFQSIIEVIINLFFIEMIELVSGYFEDSKQNEIKVSTLPPIRV